MFRQSVFVVGFLWVSQALAGYDPGASDNIAIYWGQNSAGSSNAGQSQKSLSEYCANADVDVIPIAFISNFNPVSIDLTNMDSNKNIG